MEHLTYFTYSHYLPGIMVLFTLAALIISIVYYNRHPNLRILTWYIAFSLLQDIATGYALPSPTSVGFRLLLWHIITISFMFFEFTACSLLILYYVRSPLRRRIIRINGLLFFGLMIFVAALAHPDLDNPDVVAPEAAFLVVPCLIYFYELFLTKNLRPLAAQPAFWVITGILFLNACDIPLLLTARLMGSYFREVFSINYILYIVLFVLLIRAFLCPPESKAGATF